MKKIIITLLAAFVAFASVETVALAAGKAPASAYKTPAAGIFDKKKKDLKTVTLSANIHCKNCVKKVQENIAFEKGVEGLEISVEKRQVVITYDAAKTSLETLLAAMKKIGFPATVVE